MNGKAVINVADWRSAMALKNAIAKEFSASDFDLSGIDAKSIKDIGNLDLNVITPFLKVIMQVDSSEAVNAAIMQCLAKSTYNSERITADTFEDTEARADYYEIVFECLKVNLLPFFGGLISKLSLATQSVSAEVLK